MNTKHTPGPWAVEADMNTFVIRGAPVVQTGEREIKFEFCDFVASTWGGQTKQNESNARLIAAAPDLLEAAKLVIAWHEAEDDHSKADFYQRLQMCRDSEAACRAAIAKATGSAT